MIQGSLNPNITFIVETLWPVAWNPKFTSVIWGKNRKMQIKNVKTKISTKKMRFFLMFQWSSFNPKISFLGQKVCSVVREQTHTHTETDSHRETHTHTKVNTEDTLSWFQEFFLQPIIKGLSETFCGYACGWLKIIILRDGVQ